MKFFAIALFCTTSLLSAADPVGKPVADDPSLRLTSAAVTYDRDLDCYVFAQTLAGKAASVVPAAHGALDGAPVLCYAFPTNLPPQAVGFSKTDGVLTLVVTTHPDFDDTHLWDENGDGDTGNDGAIYHSHWVVLTKDARVSGGFAVKEFAKDDASVKLPATSCGMPMYMDAPGFSISVRDNTLRVLVPADRIHQRDGFQFDAVTCWLEVNTSDKARPMLGIYKVYTILSGDLSLPQKAPASK